MIQKYIRNVPIGTRIIYGNIPAVVIARRGQYSQTLIGLDKIVHGTGWPRNNGQAYGIDIAPEYDYVKYFWWVENTEIVEVPETQIQNINQVCVGCNQPAPHAKPNVGDKFVCPPCMFLATLDVGAVGG